MKQFFYTILLIVLLPIQSVHAKTVEIDVHGMTCAFCVDSLERKFNEMDSVSKVEVSLKLNRVRLIIDNSLNNETIRQTILDAGFTPVKITEIPN